MKIINPLLGLIGIGLAGVSWAHAAPPGPTVSLDKMIGQMLMFGIDGASPQEPHVKDVRDALRRGEIGGVLLLGRNIKSQRQIKQLTTFLRTSRNDELTPLISIDQEGGFVERLKPSHGIPPIPSAKLVARTHSVKSAYAVYANAAQALAKAGFNVNFGPVVDLDVNPTNPVIGAKKRSYGKSSDTVVRFARQFILAHKASGLASAAKHFPGHGSSTSDTHVGTADITKTWSPEELAPYIKLNQERLLDMVMISHVYHQRFSNHKLQPATLSAKAVTGVLRNEIGFKGVIITDDLDMDAVRKRYPFDRILIGAIKAGNDILLISRAFSGDAKQAHRIIKQAVKRGEITKERITQSYQRIVTLKRRLLQRQRAAENKS